MSRLKSSATISAGTRQLVTDAYADNRTTGSFILIDEASGVTVGAGLIG